MSKQKSPNKKGNKGTGKRRVKKQSTKQGLPEAPGIQEKYKEDAPTAATQGLFRKIFLGVAAAMLLSMSILSFDFGISGDEYDMAEYGKASVSFYSSFGQDTSSFDMKIDRDNAFKYYGVFFDLTAAGFSAITPLDEYDARHLLNSWIGFLAMLFCALWVREIAGWRAALVALLLIFFSPRFFGHSMNNPKDIPFAFGFAMALYGFTRLLKTYPKPSRASLIFSVLGIGVAIGTRVGGLLLIPYLFLFLGIDHLARNGHLAYFSSGQGWSRLLSWSKLKTYLIYALGVSILGYFVGLIFWPYGLIAPFSHPFDTLARISDLPISLRELFEGEHTPSADLPWYYSPKFILITIPLIVIAGFLAFFALLKPLSTRFDKRFLFMAGFSAIFPVAYIVYQDSNVFGGWRHLNFSYPSIVAVSAIGLEGGLRLFKEQKVGQWVITGLLALSLGMSAYWYVQSHPNQYTYFNVLVGGLEGAYPDYETDYYYNGVREAVDWVRESDLYKNGDSLVIMTNAFPQVHSYFRGDPKVKKVDYSHYYNRHQKRWDIGIFSYKFVNREQIINGSFPPSTAVYTVKQGNAPFAVVIDRKDERDYKVYEAMKNKNLAEATRQGEAYLQAHPDAAILRHAVATAYFQQSAQDPAAKQKALDLAKENEKYYPGHTGSLALQAQVYAQDGKFEEAKKICERALANNPAQPFLQYIYAVALANTGNNQKAAEHAMLSVQYNPRFKQGYLLAAQLLRQLGREAEAQRYEAAGNSL